MHLLNFLKKKNCLNFKVTLTLRWPVTFFELIFGLLSRSCFIICVRLTHHPKSHMSWVKSYHETISMFSLHSTKLYIINANSGTFHQQQNSPKLMDFPVPWLLPKRCFTSGYLTLQLVPFWKITIGYLPTDFSGFWQAPTDTKHDDLENVQYLLSNMPIFSLSM